MQRILLATDGSDHAARAAAFAGSLSATTSAPVDVVHVVAQQQTVPPLVMDEFARLEHMQLTPHDVLESLGRRIVDTDARRVKDAQGDVGNCDVLFGNAAHEISAYAERNDCDVIVMGRRGLGDLKGLLMGSVSHRVGQLSDKTLVTTE